MFEKSMVKSNLLLLIWLCFECIRSIYATDIAQSLDLMTYIDEINKEVISTRDELEVFDSILSVDLRQLSPALELVAKKKTKIIETKLNLLYEAELVSVEAAECIEQRSKRAVISKMFAAPQFKNECRLDTRYENKLMEALTDLDDIEEESKNLSAEFVNANLWCSSNFDEAECYLDVRRQVIEKAEIIRTILSTPKSLRTIILQDFEQGVVSCGDKAIDLLNNLQLFMEETIESCMQAYS